MQKGHALSEQSESKGFVGILVLVAVVIVAALGGAYYFGMQRVSPTPSPIPDETVNWKTYVDNKYIFKYPSDWSLEKFDYLNGKILGDGKRSVAIHFSDDQQPYGFGNPDSTVEYKDLLVKVGEEEYKTKETIVDNKSVFVDFHTNSPNVVYILFGTGYPTGGAGSMEDYKILKPTILKILSTFRFID